VIYLDALTADDAEQVRIWRNQNPEGARTPYLLNWEMQADWYEREVCNRDSKHRYWAVRQSVTEEERRGIEINRPTSGMRFTEEDVRRQRVWLNNEDWFVGISGLTNIEWENSRAEIALMVDPSRRGKGIGREALRETLKWGFERMGLRWIHGLCYHCNGSLSFWRKVADEWAYYTEERPNQKLWDGAVHDAFYFDIEAWEA